MKDEFRTVSQSEVKAAIDGGCVLPGVYFASRPVCVRQESVRPVGVPTAAPARRKFLRNWAKRNARRMAAGLSPILLVLPLAAAASAADGPVDLSGIQGVAGFEVLDNGDVQVTLDNGRVVVIRAASVQIGDDGTVLVSEGVAQAIAAAEAGPVDPGHADGGGANLAMLGPGGALALLAGAGGGGGAAAAAVVKAFVIDGYVSGATIFGDANANGLLDTGEVQATTAADGSFDQSLFAADVPLVAVGGIDISTGKPFTGTLKAPAGSTVVTPLTTLVQSALENGNGTQTAAQVADAVRQSLGLAPGVDLLNQDPVAAAEAGDLTQLQSAAKIAAIINLVSAAAPNDPGGAVDAVLKELTANGGPIDLTTQTTIDAALAKAAGLIDVTSADLAKAIATATTQIDTTTSLGSLEGTQTVIQGTLTDAVTQSVGDTTGPSALSTANNDTTYYNNAVGLRPVITSSTPTTDPINEAGGLQISGTGQVGSTVTATIGLASASAQVDKAGNWSITFPSLGIKAAGTPDENIAVVVTAETGGVTSASATGAPVYLVDTQAPGAFSFTEITGQTGQYINAAQINGAAIKGSAEPGSVLSYTVNGGAEQSLTVGADGLVSIDISGNYIQGLNTVGYVLRDLAGNVAAGNGNISYFVDTIPPTAPAGLALSGAGGDFVVNIAEAAGATLTGNATAGASVEYTTAAGASGTVVADNTGAFSIPLAGLLQTGSTTVSVREIDPAGNLSTPSQISVSADLTAPSVPTIDPVAGDNLVDGTEISSSVNFTGTAENGSTVTLSIDGTASGTVTVANGIWSIPVALAGAAASDGLHQVAVTSTDAAGNVTTSAPLDFTVAATSPSATIDPLAVGAVANAAEIATAITVNGSYANASAVSVRVLTGATEVVAPQTATLSNGSWSVDLNLATLGDGAYTIEVTASGNNLQNTASLGLAIDATAPAAPILDPVAGDGIVNAAESAGGAYNVTGTAEPGSAVKIYEGTTLLGQATAAANGAFSVSLAATNGAYNLSVTATDAAGNVSAGAPLAFTVDTVAPTAPIFDAASATYDATSAAAAVISGSGEAGSTVTLSSTLFGSDINLVVASNGTWTTGPLDLSSNADSTYTITAIATDPAGNSSAAADATRLVSTGAGVTITPIGAPPGGLVLESAAEFAKFSDPKHIENAEGYVSGVAAGTTVSMAVTGTDGSGTAFTLNYSGTTDANGYFNIVLPTTDITAHDGMTSPGTITISAPGAADYTLDLLINSAIADGTNTVFLAGHYAVSPLDYANTTLGLTGVAINQAQTMSDGTFVVVMNSDKSGATLGYDIIATYDGTGSVPAEFFAFDGVNTADVADPAAFLSQAFIRGDEVLVLQPSVSGTVSANSVNLQQSDSPLFTVYRIPLTSLAAALPSSGSVDNINTSAAGVTSFAISLSDIDTSHTTGSGIAANTVYQFLDLSNTTGQVIGLITREAVGPGTVSDAYLVGVDLTTQAVATSVKVDYSGLLLAGGGGELDPSKVYALLGTDALGAYTTATLPTPDQGDGLHHGVVYDYTTAQTSLSVRGNDGVQDLMITSGGNEVMDGGLGPVGSDNDLAVVGNAGGTATALKVTVASGIVTVAVDTATLLTYLANAGVTDTGASQVPISFDLFAAGSATLTNLAGTTYGSHTAAISTDTGVSSYGFSVARVTVDLDLQGLQKQGAAAPATTELFSTGAAGVDGTVFYGFGVSVATDPSIATVAPQFDGLVNVGGVDGSGSQIVVLQNSGSRGGQDHIIGFDSSSGSNEDVIHVQADFGSFQGTGLQSVAAGGTLTLANNTGIVVFEGTNSIEDPAVISMVQNAGISLVSQDLIVAVADTSTTGLFTLSFDANGVATTDFFGRIDGLTDLSTFGADNIQLNLPTV